MNTDCATIVKRGYLYDKKMGLLPVTVVSVERERERKLAFSVIVLPLCMVLWCLVHNSLLRATVRIPSVLRFQW